MTCWGYPLPLNHVRKSYIHYYRNCLQILIGSLIYLRQPIKWQNLLAITIMMKYIFLMQSDPRIALNRKKWRALEEAYVTYRLLEQTITWVNKSVFFNFYWFPTYGMPGSTSIRVSGDYSPLAVPYHHTSSFVVLCVSVITDIVNEALNCS